MTDPVSNRLLELQIIDGRIRDACDRIASFGARLEEVDAAAAGAEKEAGTTTQRVQELRMEERRLLRSVEEKRLRMERLESRLKSVRTVREEAAVQAELGIVRRAVDSEEQDVVNLMDQIARFEERLTGQREAVDEARAAVGPRKEALLAERAAIESKLDELASRREALASKVDPQYRLKYDNLAKGGRRTAVAPMTEDGACGVCYSMIPLQIQNEIRASAPLVLCEACGVIVTSPPEEAGETE